MRLVPSVATLFALLLLVTATGCPPGLTESGRPDTSSTKSYPFTFETISVDGEAVSKDDFLGKVLIVDLWGTWCPPCRMEVPHFVELQEELGPEGLQVIGISFEQVGTVNEAIDKINEFTQETPVNYPLLIGPQELLEQVPNMNSFPTTLFIDRQGKVRRTIVGYHSKEELLAYVEPLLAEAE